MPREINDFRRFNEANIRNNKGLDRDYIDNIKSTEQAESNRKIQRREVENPNRIMPMVEEIMEIQGGQIRQTMFGPMPEWHDYEKKEKIEQLARDIIQDRYGRLINSMGVEMDIKLVDPRELQDMKEGCEMCDSPEPPAEYEETDDEGLRNDIDKRKIVNIITQGSAKNVHRLIHLYREKIEELDPRLFELMDKLIKSNEAMEWMIPENDSNGKMIREMMNGFTKTEFENDDDASDFKEMSEDIDIEEAMTDEDFDLDKAFEDWNGKIKVTARAIDLVVLLHESVKGIFEVLGSPSIPEHDEQRASDIMANTDTLKDEFEDLRYGPRIREDLLNWVNSNNKINQIEDGFEFVWGEMVSIESSAFLDLFFDSIISKTGIADKWLDDLLNKLIEEDKNLKTSQFEYDQNKSDYDNSNSWGKNTPSKPKEIEKSPSSSAAKDTVDQEPDYSKMKQGELSLLRDKLLDAGDFEALSKMTKYLK